MPGTAAEMGVSNPNDPAANIDGGLHYFSNILNGPAHGNYRTAAMGYNAGPNRSNFPQSSQSYADQFVARLPQQPQPGGQPQMPPQQPPASLGQMAAPNIGADPNAASLQYQGPSLASLATMPNVKQPSKFTAGNILGTLGDALSAYGGKAPTFGPFLREQQMMQQQQNFEREKFQQELSMRMYAMTHPQDMMDGIAFANAPKSVQEAMVYRENALHPTVAGVQQPNGSVINTVIPRQLPPQVGEVQDGHKFLGGDPANPNSWQAVQ